MSEHCRKHARYITQTVIAFYAPTFFVFGLQQIFCVMWQLLRKVAVIDLEGQTAVADLLFTWVTEHCTFTKQLNETRSSYHSYCMILFFFLCTYPISITYIMFWIHFKQISHLFKQFPCISIRNLKTRKVDKSLLSVVFSITVSLLFPPIYICTLNYVTVQY